MTEIVMLEGPDTRAAEIDAFRYEFLRYAAMPDLSAPCPVGRLKTDFDGSKLRQSVWQVVADAMSDKGDFTRRAVEILCQTAGAYYLPEQAKALLSDMAQHWAEQRSEL